MEIAIAVIIILILGLVTSLIWAGGQKKKVDAAEQSKSQIKDKLEAEKQRSEQLTIELDQTAQSNDNAIQLLYLMTLSLQACGFALRRELDRSKHLDENYHKLVKAYDKLVGNYEDFREDIKSRARRRLVKKGVGIALTFVPGLAMIDILSDLGEILSVVTEADEAFEPLDIDLDDIQESGAYSNEASEVSDSGMPVGGTSFLPLIPKVQTGVEEISLQNVSVESTTQDPSDLDDFVENILTFMEDSVGFLTDDEYLKVIAEMIDNLQKLDYELRYPSDTAQNRRQRRRK